jgi:hypothetical protein
MVHGNHESPFGPTTHTQWVLAILAPNPVKVVFRIVRRTPDVSRPVEGPNV